MKLKFMDIFGEQIYAYFHPNKNGLCFRCKKNIVLCKAKSCSWCSMCHLKLYSWYKIFS